MKESDLGNWYVKALELSPGNSEIAIKYAKFMAGKAPFLQTDGDKMEAWDRIQKAAVNCGDDEIAEIALDSSLDLDMNLITKYVERGTGRFIKECKFALSPQASVELVLDKTSLFSTRTWCQWAFAQGDYEGILAVISALRSLVDAVQARFAIDMTVARQQASRLEFNCFLSTERYQSALKASDTVIFENSREKNESMLIIYTALEMHDEAIKLISAMIEDIGTNAELRSDLGWHHFSLHQYEDALKQLTEAESLSPDNPEIVYRLGRTHLAMQNQSLALNCFLRVVKADAEHGPAFLQLGNYYAGQGDWTRAEKCYSRSLRLDGSLVPAAVGLAGIWTRRAWNAPKEIRSKAAEGVISLLEPISGENLRNGALWRYLGIAYGWAGAGPKACTALQMALKWEHADELQCLLLLADAYRRDKKLVAAGKAYARALEVNPDCPMARIGLASVRMESGVYEEAVEQFQALLDIMQGDGCKEAIAAQLSKSHGLYCQQLINESEFAAAFDQLRAGLQSLPSSPSLLVSWKAVSLLCDLALLFKQNSQFSQLKLPSIGSSDESSLYSEIVEALASEPFLQASAKAMWQCLSLASAGPAQSDIWTALAQKLYDGHAFDLAEICLLQALRLNKQHPGAWALYGLVAMAQGRPPLAQHALITSLTIADSASAWLALAQLYIQPSCSDPQLAQMAVERAQMADVEEPRAWWAQAQMEAQGTEKQMGVMAEAVKCPRAASLLFLNKVYARNSWSHSTADPLTLKLALKRANGLLPSDACIANLYAIILERQDRADPRLTELYKLGLPRVESLQNLRRSLIISGQYAAANELERVNSPVQEYLKAVMNANLNSNTELLAAFTASDGPISESAIWEKAKLCMKLGKDISWLPQNEESVSSFLFRMVIEADQEAAGHPLMHLLEMISSGSQPEPPAAEVLWTLTRYLMWRGCVQEAFHFYMSVLVQPSLIIDSRLREGLAVMLDELPADSPDRPECIPAIKAWLAEEVPQLIRKPALEQLDEWYERLFPRSSLVDSIPSEQAPS